MTKLKRTLSLTMGLALVLTCFSATSGRAFWTNINYFDESGAWVGSEFIGCVGRPILEGIRTDNYTEQTGDCL